MASSIINSDDGSVSGTTGLKTTGGDDGELAFESSGTEVVRIDSSGNVGIGVTSMDQKVVISGNLRVTNGTAGYTSGLIYGLNGNDAFLSNQANGYLLFGTNNTERMRIDSDGNLMMGTTTLVGHQSGNVNSAVALYQTGQIAATSNGSEYTAYINKRDNTTGGLIRFRYNGSAIGDITNTTSSTSYNTSSDYRLKEDWQPMSGSIDRVKALNPVNFAWKIDGTRVDGFLAHEAQEVVPEAVTGEKDAMRTEEYEVTPAVLDDDGNVVTEAVMGTREVPEYQGIDQAKLVPLLTAALQEAVAKIEALETRISALEG